MNDAILIFIVPPDLAVLESRLRGRQTDSEEQILKRLAKARVEVAEAKSYDYWICNDDLERASELLKSILIAERNRRLSKPDLVEGWLGSTK